MSDDEDPAVSDGSDNASAVSSEDLRKLLYSDRVEWHRMRCEEGNGWSHGFLAVRDGNNGEITSVRDPMFDILCHFSEENWAKMGDDISKSNCLDNLKLYDSGVYVRQAHNPNEFSAETIKALFGDRRYNCPSLELVDLHGNKFGSAGISAILPFLKSLSNLKRLDLSNTNLDVNGARLLSDALDVVSTEVLSLSGDGIGDEDVDCILQARNSFKLEELNILGNRFGLDGIEAISRFLSRDDTALREFNTSYAEADHAKVLVDSISSRSKLEELFFNQYSHGRDGGRRQRQGHTCTEPNFLRLICNTSSFEAMCQSNHQLFVAGTRALSDPILGEALGINNRARKGVSVRNRLRSKLRKYYLKGSLFDVQPFADMDVLLMPYALELITKKELPVEIDYRVMRWDEVASDNLDGIYRIVRNCHLPELLSFPSWLQSVNAALRAENVSLKGDNERLRIEIEELRATQCPTLSIKRAKTN